MKACNVCQIPKKETCFPKRSQRSGRSLTCHGCLDKQRKLRHPDKYWASRCALEKRPAGIERRKRSYRKNLAKRLLAGRERRLRIKIKVLSLYGGCCANPNCKITEVGVLSIDHINNDGSLERGRSGQSIYRKLINKPKRSDLQVLCLNCQFRKRLYGNDFSTWETQKRFTTER